MFAKGYNMYKLIWIFVVTSFIGSLFEILWVFISAGKLMSRSSLLYGQFSVIWGLGCVLLTIVLHRLEGKRNFLIFGVGVIAGGGYEYLCSFLSEKVFGVIFWDYSGYSFNVHGRINLQFCFFWGLISVVWVQNIYPFLSKHIESIPLTYRKQLTMMVLAFMIFDMGISAVALLRMHQRQEGIIAHNPISIFLDEHYSDEYLSQRYQNMKLAIN
ncbi:MAG: putative ABC transporter permease [Erysipelotrichaceae bacterium]|nr:putative ABC transporter permease [Erysipelotrichaceae bacterium]